jgi:hypothetical protein
MAVCFSLRSILIITTGFTDLSAEAHRNQTAALLATTATLDPFGTPAGLTVLGGVHSGFFMSGGTSSGLVGTINPGRAVIPSASADGGAYVVTMTETETVTFAPGNGVHNRYDLVCLKIDEVPEPAEPPAEGEPVPEPEYVPGASLVVIQGTGVTGTTTPPVPATPANAIPLHAVKILATTTVASSYIAGTVIDKRARLKLANQDRQPFAMAAGQVSVNMRTTSYFGTAGITFPAGRFRTPPIVTVSLGNAPGGSGNVSPRALNPTPFGATVYCYTADLKGADVNHTAVVNWTAIQMAEDNPIG